MRTACVLLNYGAPGRTLAALDSLSSVAGRVPDQVFVVDNGSPTVYAGQLSGGLQRFPSVELIRLPDNLGFAGGMNAAVSHAERLGFDSLVLMNNDITFEPRWFDELVAGWDGVSIRSPVIRELETDCWWWTGGEISRWLRRAVVYTNPPDSSGSGVRNVSFVSGCAMLVSIATWRRLGGYFEPYFMYWEDVDLSHRAAIQSIPLQAVGRSVISHAIGGSTGPGGEWSSPSMHYLSAKNRWLFLSRSGIAWPLLLLNILLMPARLLRLLARVLPSGAPAWRCFCAQVAGTRDGLMLLMTEVRCRGSVARRLQGKAKRR